MSWGVGSLRCVKLSIGALEPWTLLEYGALDTIGHHWIIQTFLRVSLALFV